MALDPFREFPLVVISHDSDGCGLRGVANGNRLAVDSCRDDFDYYRFRVPLEEDLRYAHRDSNCGSRSRILDSHAEPLSPRRLFSKQTS